MAVAGYPLAMSTLESAVVPFAVLPRMPSCACSDQRRGRGRGSYVRLILTNIDAAPSRALSASPPPTLSVL